MRPGFVIACCAFLTVTGVLLGGCAEAFEDRVARPLSGEPLTLRISPSRCEEAILSPLPPAEPPSQATRVREVRSLRGSGGQVGEMLSHSIGIALYEAPEAPVDRVLAAGVDAVLAGLVGPDRPVVAELTLSRVWVDSTSAAGITELTVPIVASFGFSARLELDAQRGPAEAAFRGEASRRVRYALARDHEGVLEEAFCDALRRFRAWAEMSLAEPR